MKNTATWVDERYARLLGRQLYDRMRAEVGDEVMTLKAMRRTSIYLHDEPVRIGFGVGRPGRVVFYIDTSTTNETMYIATMFYDDHGRVLVTNRYVNRPEIAQITQHVYRRMFERMRTNAPDDVVRIIRHMVRLPRAPMFMLEATIAVGGVGAFHAITDKSRMQPTSNVPVWVLKTFIPEK